MRWSASNSELEEPKFEYQQSARLGFVNPISLLDSQWPFELNKIARNDWHQMTEDEKRSYRQ